MLKLFVHWAIIITAVLTFFVILFKAIFNWRFWFGLFLGAVWMDLVGPKPTTKPELALRRDPPATWGEAFFLDKIEHGEILWQWPEKIFEIASEFVAEVFNFKLRQAHDDTLRKINDLRAKRREAIKQRVTIDRTAACGQIPIDPKTVKTHARELWANWYDPNYDIT